MNRIEDIMKFFKNSNIDYEFADNEFIIKSKYKVLLTCVNNELFLLDIEGVDVGSWLNSAEYEINFLLELISNIYFNKYKIVKKGFVKRNLYLITDTKRKRNFIVGKIKE